MSTLWDLSTGLARFHSPFHVYTCIQDSIYSVGTLAEILLVSWSHVNEFTASDDDARKIDLDFLLHKDVISFWTSRPSISSTCHLTFERLIACLAIVFWLRLSTPLASGFRPEDFGIMCARAFPLPCRRRISGDHLLQSSFHRCIIVSTFLSRCRQVFIPLPLHWSMAFLLLSRITTMVPLKTKLLFQLCYVASNNLFFRLEVLSQLPAVAFRYASGTVDRETHCSRAWHHTNVVLVRRRTLSTPE